MGGQACVFYGASEFTRDLDLAILASDENLEKLTGALEELEAERIAIPPLSSAVLAHGHAVHFRCKRPDMGDLRIDVMTRMRGVDEYSKLWDRRTQIEEDGVVINLMNLADLVRAKKTQREKDWPMITRLVERDYFFEAPTAEKIRFWLEELRKPELLVEAVQRFPEEAALNQRPVIVAARAGDLEAVDLALDQERKIEQKKDKEYWEPLRREMEEFRRQERHG